MQVTTKNIIKFLPFDQAFKDKVLEKIDTLPLEQKGALEQLLWDAYYALYDMKLQENLQLALDRVGKNQEKADGELNKRVREQTEKEMEHEFASQTTQVDLSATREKLAEIIEEKKN